METEPQGAQRPELRAETRAIFAKRVTLLLFGVALVLAVGVMLYTVVAVRSTQKTNSGKIDTTNQTLHLIQSCTTPGRECYERGQHQTAGAIASINQVSIIAAACATRPENRGDVQAVQSCVIAVLARQVVARKP